MTILHLVTLYFVLFSTLADFHPSPSSYKQGEPSKILDLVSAIPNLIWMKPLLEQKDLKAQQRIIRQWASLIFWQTASEAERKAALKVREGFLRKAMKHRRHYHKKSIR